jgi:hypothetical protein
MELAIIILVFLAVSLSIGAVRALDTLRKHDAAQASKDARRETVAYTGPLYSRSGHEL